MHFFLIQVTDLPDEVISHVLLPLLTEVDQSQLKNTCLELAALVMEERSGHVPVSLM